ncbi:TetR/AcrR family transcriptional regulator [Melissospora conviva]|uniref:TetR/AcrR family transcriptional regulator n=1 Tax=Melissospora conviva TaxID=3388432 RepID=UPI003B7875FC
MDAATSGRPLRRDAERNRRRTLHAAEELFARHGLDVTLDDVARHAGLGVGTVYRRFANKEELIEALFEEKVAALAGLAERAAAAPDPGTALIDFLTEACTRHALDHGLREISLSNRYAPARIAVVKDRLVPAIRTLVARARSAGALRADFTAEDVPVVLLMVGAAADFGQQADPQAWRRYLVLLLDGLPVTRRCATALPGPSLTEEELAAATARFSPPRR